MSYLTRRLNTIVPLPDDYHTDAKKEGIAGVCGRGWVGTKGNCKRRSAKGKLTAKQKAGAQTLADRIRAERGMKPRVSAESRFNQALKKAGGANDLPARKTRATPKQERKFQEALSNAANPPQPNGLATRPTRKEKINALAYQAGKLLGDRAKADIEITRKAIEQNAPAVKKALVEGAKKAAFNAGKGFGAAARAVGNAKKKRK